MLNQISVVGNMCGDPVPYGTQDNQVAAFTVACGRDYKNALGNYETDFFEVRAFGKLAEYCNINLGKGQKVVVHGRLVQSDYVDQHGNNRRSYRIHADHVYKLPSVVPDRKEQDERPAALPGEQQDEYPF